MHHRRPAKLVPAFAVAAALLAGAAACGGDDGASSSATSGIVAPAFDADRFSGVYKGTWENLGNGEKGPAMIEIQTDKATGKAKLVLDFDGNYLGLGDPPRHEMDATFTDKGALGEGHHPLFGDYHVTVDPNGEMRGDFLNVAGGLIKKLSYTGKLDGTHLDADYTVERGDGKVAKAIAKLTKA